MGEPTEGRAAKIFAKVIVVGDTGTGKTCLVNQFCKSEFRTDTKATVGTDFSLKPVEVDGRAVTLQIWDTAGQERYRTMTTMFYRGAQAGIIVFDITKRSSFEHLPNWLETLRKEVSENPDFQVPYIVIGNKLDIEELREVSREEAEAWCKVNGIFHYFETSAKNSTNLVETFQGVARGIITLKQTMEDSSMQYRTGIVLNRNAETAASTDSTSCTRC